MYSESAVSIKTDNRLLIGFDNVGHGVFQEDFACQTQPLKIVYPIPSTFVFEPVAFGKRWRGWPWSFNQFTPMFSTNMHFQEFRLSLNQCLSSFQFDEYFLTSMEEVFFLSLSLSLSSSWRHVLMYYYLSGYPITSPRKLTDSITVSHEFPRTGCHFLVAFLSLSRPTKHI